jgi:hypothetical protein
MDDFLLPSLKESRFEWASRLTNILTPHIIDGVVSIFEESCKLCRDTNEPEKYLMTFQNFLSRIPKWNENMIETETKRIVEKSHCKYLEDLVICVHIIQLKLLSAIRVCSKQKKIDINVPKLNTFIHKVYISVARKFYKNAYLFETGISRLKKQQNMSEIEKYVEDCILIAIRESIPIEDLLKAYMADTFEDEYKEEIQEIKEEVIQNGGGGGTTDKPVVEEQEKEQESIKISAEEINTVEPTSIPTPNPVFLEIPKLEPYIDEGLEKSITEKQKVSFEPSTKFDNNIKIHDDVVNLDVMNLTSDTTKVESDLILNDIEVLY